MQSNELETIAATMQEALHRAYALGRSDALRRVVELVQSDDLGSKTVPLLSHSAAPPVDPHHVEAEPTASIPMGDATHADGIYADTAQHSDAVQADAAHNDNAEAVAPDGEGYGSPASPRSIKNFLQDYLYPLGGKK